MNPKKDIKSEYLGNVYNPKIYKRIIKNSVKTLKDLKFDTIAFRGSSGAAFAFPLSVKLNKTLIHIRKDLGHTQSEFEGYIKSKSYIIVDDFIDSGKTVRKIESSVRKRCGKAKLKYIVMANWNFAYDKQQYLTVNKVKIPIIYINFSEK